MTRPAIDSISAFFIVNRVPRAHLCNGLLSSMGLVTLGEQDPEVPL
jgi:hypothetical protein